MQKTIQNNSEIILVGIKTRTSLQQELNPATAKIGAFIQQYFQQQIPDQISHRANPGTLYCVYTEYESDYRGEYTYFIGEKVDSLNANESLASLIIPAQKYAKFTTQPGEMPQVVIESWQNIWKMSPQDLGGERRYHADFEIYDERASDPMKTVLDLYIGIEDNA
jgi:predicted transcriptional regulator YdeE